MELVESVPYGPLGGARGVGELVGGHDPVLVEQDEQEMRWSVPGPQAGEEGGVSHAATPNRSRAPVGPFR